MWCFLVWRSPTLLAPWSALPCPESTRTTHPVVGVALHVGVHPQYTPQRPNHLEAFLYLLRSKWPLVTEDLLRAIQTAAWTWRARKPYTATSTLIPEAREMLLNLDPASGVILQAMRLRTKIFWRELHYPSSRLYTAL